MTPAVQTAQVALADAMARDRECKGEWEVLPGARSGGRPAHRPVIGSSKARCQLLREAAVGRRDPGVNPPLTRQGIECAGAGRGVLAM